MNDTPRDHDDLPQRLFAEATARLENALEAAVRGQAARASTIELHEAVRGVLQEIDASRCLVEAALTLRQ